jgi:hypothetical protein
MGSIMKTASEYRQHAQECRMLAHQMPAGEQRDQFLEMARTWDSLAETREGLVHRYPELDTRISSSGSRSQNSASAHD